jgi:hypothetical protein
MPPRVAPPQLDPPQPPENFQAMPETPQGLQSAPTHPIPNIRAWTPENPLMRDEGFDPLSPQPVGGPAEKYPVGPLQGQPFLRPQYDNLGATRPLGPGEYVKLPDGSWASEMTNTVQLQNGQWAVVPGLWIINGVPMRVDEDQSAQLADQSGLTWRTFPDEPSAEAYANQREQIWQTTPFGRSDMQQPLWSRTWPPPR